jgi:hypothetical protein
MSSLCALHRERVYTFGRNGFDGHFVSKGTRTFLVLYDPFKIVVKFAAGLAIRLCAKTLIHGFRPPYAILFMETGDGGVKGSHGNGSVGWVEKPFYVVLGITNTYEICAPRISHSLWGFLAGSFRQRTNKVKAENVKIFKNTLVTFIFNV